MINLSHVKSFYILCFCFINNILVEIEICKMNNNYCIQICFIVVFFLVASIKPVKLCNEENGLNTNKLTRRTSNLDIDSITGLASVRYTSSNLLFVSRIFTYTYMIEITKYPSLCEAHSFRVRCWCLCAHALVNTDNRVSDI